MLDKKLTVIYFTVVPLSTATNGGNIACRNHIVRLKDDDRIDLHVVAAPLHSDIPLTHAFLDSVGGENLVIPRLPNRHHQEAKTLRGALKFALQAASHFPWEFEALNQPQFDEAIAWAVKHWKADIVVVDYLFSALFCPRLIEGPTRIALITLNREEQFHRDMIRLGLVPHDPVTAEWSARRLGRFERRIYEAVDLLIALNPDDVPPYLPAKKKLSITPYLNRRKPWSYTGTNSAFFVGHMAHFPNREAIEFIATRLAPRVGAICPDLRFQIVGASAEDVPPEWRHPQIEYLGISDTATVETLFTSADAMICPINNTYGMKYKIAEALAHGTPLIANSEALRCVPYIKTLPTFLFNDADTAARLLLDVIGHANKAKQLNTSIVDSVTEFMQSQTHRWSNALSSVL